MTGTGTRTSHKAYVLMSGGLDSTIAVKMLQEQGIEVTGVYISTGFCITAQQKRNGRFNYEKPDVFSVAEELGVDLEVIDISDEYINIITHPKYGYGKNINPCVDCRIYMLQKTAELMQKNGYDFIATGEVVGQRPKSQMRDTSRLIEREAGLRGYLLRPLSAKLHPPTIAEESGWLDRSKLGNLNGRSRKPQYALAKKYNIKNISSPAGGCCYLTDETYAVRFKNLLADRQVLLPENDSHYPLDFNAMTLMSIGRHIKLATGVRLIVGRNEVENRLLEHYQQDRYMLYTPDEIPGPTSLIDITPNPGKTDIIADLNNRWQHPENKIEIPHDFTLPEGLNLAPEILSLAASLTARYSDGKKMEKVPIFLSGGGLESPVQFFVTPAPESEILGKSLMIKANEDFLLEKQ